MSEKLDYIEVIKLFVEEKFPTFRVSAWDDGQVRIDRTGLDKFSKICNISLVSIYPDHGFYYVCHPSHMDKFSLDLELGQRWNSTWNKVEVVISDPKFFRLLERSIILANEHSGGNQ